MGMCKLSKFSTDSANMCEKPAHRNIPPSTSFQCKRTHDNVKRVRNQNVFNKEKLKKSNNNK